MKRSPKFKDITGQKFGRLTAIEPVFKTGGGRTRTKWRCNCDCGNSVCVDATDIRTGNTKSCGCLHRERASRANITHGMTDSTEYAIWHAIKSRCTNRKNAKFKNYGGRGIKICERWMSFDNFLADMGNRPSKSDTIERVEVNGWYGPDNCIWASQKTQQNNRRNNHTITHAGKTMTLSQWAAHLGVDRQRISRRLKKGWPLDKVLSSDDFRFSHEQ